MKPVRLIPFLLLTVTLLIATPGVAGAAGLGAPSAGVIEGRLVAKSGTVPVGGVAVNLRIGTGAATPESRTASTAPDGSFRFEAVPLVANAVYLVRVDYDGGAYFREVTFQQDATTATTGPIDVYASTRSDAELSFARLRMLVTAVGANGLQVVENGAFVNSGTAAYIGSDTSPTRTSLLFQVPLAAINLAVATGLNRNTLVDAPGGFAALEAIVPGEHQFAYIYDLASNGSSLVVTRNFVYRTELFQLYVPTGMRVSSPFLTDSGVSTLTNGQRFRIYTARNIPAGTALTATVSGLPSGPGAINPLYPAMAVFVLLLGIGLLLVYGRRRKPDAAMAAGSGAPQRTTATSSAIARAVVSAPTGTGTPSPDGDEPAARLARRRQLLLDLAELDDRHAVGEIDEDSYRQLRARHKQELTNLITSPSAASLSR